MDLYNNSLGRDTVGTYELFPSAATLNTRLINKIKAGSGQRLVYYPGYSSQYGSTGTYVKMIQEQLNQLAAIYNHPEWNCGAVDGDFGPATKTAVVNFQGYHGLVKDGIVGPASWHTMIPVLN